MTWETEASDLTRLVTAAFDALAQRIARWEPAPIPDGWDEPPAPRLVYGDPWADRTLPFTDVPFLDQVPRRRPWFRS